MIAALVTLGFLCAHCETVRHSAEPQYALDVVVLPDGFTEAQLPTFRCATSVLAQQLVGMAPFNDTTKPINIHRVDLVSSTVSGLVAPGCTDRCVRIDPTLPAACSGAAPTSWGRSYDGTGLVPTVNFGAQLCGGGSKDRCEFLSISDTSLAAAVGQSAEVPAADLIVVLVNAGTPGGVAYTAPMTFYTGTPPVAVVTMSGIEGDGCANRLAHEIGHTFGLLDEYDYGEFVDGATSDSIPCGPNVTDPWGCADPVPWQVECTWKGAASCSDLEPQEECTANRTSGCCVAAGATFNELALPTGSGVALFEGGNYAECGFFRPTYSCRMRLNGEPFCPVCEKVIRVALTPVAASTLCVELKRDGENRFVWHVPGEVAGDPDIPPGAWEAMLRRHADGASIRRFRARVEIAGVEAWVPVREASIEVRVPSWDLVPDGRFETVLTRESDRLEDRIRIRGIVPRAAPGRPDPGGPPIPGPIPVGFARVTIRDLVDARWRARALEICLSERRPTLNPP